MAQVLSKNCQSKMHLAKLSLFRPFFFYCYRNLSNNSKKDGPPPSKSSSGEGKKEKPQQRFRHKYDEEVEGGVNKQILAEFNASMIYLSISCYYGRTRVALPGCQAYFKSMYYEEQEHALDFINYQLLRGGHVILYPITVPETNDYTDVTISFGLALEIEKRVKDQLEDLHNLAEKHRDMQLMDLISSKYMKEQNESICEMGRLLTRAKLLVDTGGLGKHLFDRELLNYVQSKKTTHETTVYH